ncbi:MAG TPA: ATP-binding protein [Gemmatimonas sp.]|uniref:ATP-binding protein n=1 Tax=Gemmatimonas sp. TaxID=1962908 RepID=UPI002ED97E05
MSTDRARTTDTKRPQRSLRERLFVAGVTMAISAVVALAVIAAAGSREQLQLRRTAAHVIEEQRIGDAVIRGVMSQLAIAGDPTSRGSRARLAAFDSIGHGVYDDVRQYLFRTLSPAERLQIESVKEEHQQMEVAARRVMAADNQQMATAAAGNNEMVQHAFQLLDALQGFVDLREQALTTLADTQGSTLQRLTIGSIAFIASMLLMQIVLAMRFVRRRVTDPLEDFTAAVARVGAGDLDVRMPRAADREFASTFQAFNEMSASLATARADLEARNDALTAALARVRATQDELVQAEKLGAIGRMTAGLAHELNNPLATVLASSELLATRLNENDPPSMEQLSTEFVEPMRREAQRARLLVRSLLQFARRAESEVGPVSLREAVDVVRELRQFAFAGAGITLQIEPIPDVLVMAERQQLQGVLLNIINNALDALKPRKQGLVRVVTRIEPNSVEVVVQDDGPGLQDPSRVFEAFYTTKGVGEGTGLGLALAERFMTSFGGSIIAGNQPSGGACFTLRFVRPQVAAPAAAQAEPDVALPIRSTSRQQRVLVVDDEPAIQRAQSLLLKRLDLEVETCDSVAAARAAIARSEFHAILCDVKMPGESGVVLFQWIRREMPSMLPHFLFVTGDIAAAELSEIAAEFPDALISKPFDAREYLLRVERALA